ncbi:endonuclease I, partial [Escherichia coli]|nr:endonuclease I [Escherichia coli]
EDRQKHLLINAQHPELDIRFVFSNPKARISKTSQTTYADWCERHGFKYAAKVIPQEWIDE